MSRIDRVTPLAGIAERAALQVRTLRTLALGQVVGAAALTSAITVGGFVVEDIKGVGTPWVGASTTAVMAGSGAMSQVLSRVMSRRGRREGMALGYGLAALGGLVACFAVQTSALFLFLIGLCLYGAGSSTNLLARYAATDLAEPGEVGRAMSWIMFASTFGAILGPLLIGPAETVASSGLGIHRYAGPWLFSSLLFTCAMGNIFVRLRPDPLLARAAEQEITARPPRTRSVDSLRVLLGTRERRLALMTMVIAQAVMVGVMAMSPIDLKGHGHEHVSAYVVSAHIAGMFAFSPLVGAYVDRLGGRAALRASAVVLLLATGLSALAADNVVLMFAAMWLLGFGWSFGLLGGSSLLVDAVPPSDRVPVQGLADLLMSVCGGIAALAYGLVMGLVGFSALALISAALTLPILIGMARLANDKLGAR